MTEVDQTTARPVKDASTVMVIRDSDAGPEVFVARRVKGMAFAGGMTVFPGGGVDAADDDPDLAWTGPAPAWWAERLGCDEPRARRLVCAAARETFEECGVLLADHRAVALRRYPVTALVGRPRSPLRIQRGLPLPQSGMRRL